MSLLDAAKKFLNEHSVEEARRRAKEIVDRNYPGPTIRDYAGHMITVCTVQLTQAPPESIKISTNNQTSNHSRSFFLVKIAV